MPKEISRNCNRLWMLLGLGSDVVRFPAMEASPAFASYSKARPLTLGRPQQAQSRDLQSISWVPRSKFGLVTGWAILKIWGRRTNQRTTCHARAQTLTSLKQQLYAAYKGGRGDEAAELFQELPSELQQQPVHRNTVLGAFANGADLEGALGWFQQYPEAGVKSSVKSYGKLVEAAASAGKPEVAKEWMSKLEERYGREPLCYSMMINAYAKANSADSASEWFQTKLRLFGEVTLVDFNQVVDAFARVGDFEGSKRWFDKAQAAGFTPDATSYTALISAISRSSRANSAEICLDLLGAMATARLAPDVVTHNAIITAYCRQHEVGKAQQHLHSVSESGIPLDACSFTPIMQTYAEEGQVQSALAWLDIMRSQDVSPDATAYTAVLLACARVLESRTARQVFEKMLEDKVQPDIIAMNTLINSNAKCGDMDAAQYFFRMSIELGLKPTVRTYTPLVEGLGHQSRLKEAMALVEEAAASGLSPDVPLYNALLKACVKAEDADSAEAILSQMSQQQLSPDAQSYNALIGVYGKLSRVEAAAGVIARMQESGLRPNQYVWTGMLQACKKAKDLAWACVTFRTLMKQGIEVDSLLLNRLSEAVPMSLRQKLQEEYI